jgi:LemA protein
VQRARCNVQGNGMLRVTMLATVVVLFSGCGYNRIQTLDEQVNEYKSQIEVQLQRRYDLVPNLVETVRAFAAQERAIFEAVTEARSRLGGAIQSGDVAQMAAANQALGGALGRLIAIAEDNPEIRSQETYRTLMDQLEGTENRIAVARRDYNTAVGSYNGYIRRFPQVLTAKMLGAGARAYYEADEAAAEAPRVQFN